MALLFTTFVTNAIFAGEVDANADHDDEDGEPKIETTVQNNLDVHSNLLSSGMPDTFTIVVFLDILRELK